MKYRHFFWDFDGTLYDTYHRITRACLRALQDLGIEADYTEVYALNKRSLMEFARVISARYPRVSQEDVLAGYAAHSEEEGIDGVRLYPGARDMLEDVRRCGGCNYLYTHRGESLFKFLERDGLGPLFTDIVTSLDHFPRKPAPDALLHLVSKHGLDVKDCVMLGDRDIDLDAGKNAGMACALFDPEGFYAAYDTTWRFASMDALRKTLLEE